MSDPTLTREAVVEALDSPRLNNFKEYNTLAALCRQQHETIETLHSTFGGHIKYHVDLWHHVNAVRALMEGVEDGDIYEYSNERRTQKSSRP